MNEQERAYFSALSRDRSENADMLEKPSMRGIKNSVVEKYSDQAHFIYELLQNADDAQAARVRFVLEPGRLIFAHNGLRHFSITDPDNEERDSAQGTLGDINAITAIANSNKTEASIGKFGVGFKAVFQYTSTPHIYDPHFSFKIERFIVPVALKEDFPGRQKGETLFVFPFDHTDRSAEEAFTDIAEKLKNLSYPLLFLSTIRSIDFTIAGTNGGYGKTIEKTYTFGDTSAEYMCLRQATGEDEHSDGLWLFSRRDKGGRMYSVGFFVDAEGKLQPVHEPAFCFFPTKEATGLNFVIHAPFLLTDSREGIRAGVPYNDEILQELAELAADAVVYLKDIGIKEGHFLIEDNIVNIIPVDPNQFSKPEDKRKVSFLPFYTAIKKKFETEEILPTGEGYAKSDHAYWAAVPQLTQLFSNDQLADICADQEARWAFTSLGRDEILRNNKALLAYIDSIVETNLSEDAIICGRDKTYYYNRALGIRQPLKSIKGITKKFTEKQSIAWLNDFYKWIGETIHRISIARNKPIFLDQHRNAAEAFDEKDQLVLFLPIDSVDMSGYKMVHPEILQDPDARQMIEAMKIKEPSLKDQIYNIILPQYKNGTPEDTDSHFLTLFNYYCSISGFAAAELIRNTKKCKFLKCSETGEAPYYFTREASALYLPKPELRAFFETKKGTMFLALQEYKKMVGKEKEKELFAFFKDLGVHEDIEVVKIPVNPQMSGRKDLPMPRSTKWLSWEETIIDGCKELVGYIEHCEDLEKSVLLWNSLLRIIETKCSKWSKKPLSKLLSGVCGYFYYSRQEIEFESSNALLLKNSKWLCNQRGEFVSPKDIARDELHTEYHTGGEAAEALLDFLGVRDRAEIKAEETSNLTAAQKEKIEWADKIKEYGIENEEDLKEFLEFKRKRSAQKPKTRSGAPESGVVKKQELDWEDIFGDPEENTEKNQTVTPSDPLNTEPELPNPHEKQRKLHTATTAVVKDILHRTKEKPAITEKKTEDNTGEADTDQDELIPSTVSYSLRIERAKQKSAEEIDKIAYLEELQNKAVNAPKYSYGWFTALLEMESVSSKEGNSGNREVSISFAKVEREAGTKRTLVLKYPNHYIPQFMEDLSDIPLVLHMGDQMKTVAIEVANIKSYTLRVKVKNSADIEGIDLHQVVEATINAKSPAFILEELRKQFLTLDYTEDFDMQKNLCENIEFIFGPPGTGKTTYLARDILTPLMREGEKCKVLVLTPTNKAADVLTRKIMDMSGQEADYEKWLIRFGVTGDEIIEESPVFRDKTFDIQTVDQCVTITTIARFPYDFFMPSGRRVYLNGINWDYIVVDEASMIPLANIIYPLYRKTPKKFIIAGDPFQIEPITSVDLWKNENIYTLVHLNSFAHPETIPHPYQVKLLTTQYRSIPDIGGLFSKFAYDGILQHYRTPDSQRKLRVDARLGIKTLNIIKFPVSKYESIYRPKRLQHSSCYQVYSALFTYEYICYLSHEIEKQHPEEIFKIGVIAPYRAQADMIEKLIAAEDLPEKVDVQVGTIHGFQGDECDIIFTVLNTPPTISGSKDMFLNKRNIINVSISRARDYLFIVMPDDDTQNVDRLQLIKRVEAMAKNTDQWSEMSTPQLEEIMFGDSQYLENNAFSTGHQSVNVYGLPEKRYEVRTEDAAVDVQIHKNA